MRIQPLLVCQIIVAIGSASAAPSTETGKDMKARGIIRAGVDSSGKVHGEFAKTTGLKHMTAVAYKVSLLDRSGKEAVVDERKHTFKVGDQFRLVIEAETDVFVYVFHQGTDNVQTILLPDRFDQGRVPFVKRGEKKVLPEDGNYFVVTAPAGVDKIRVYASPERKPELTPKEAFDNPTPEQLKELKVKQEKVFSGATNKAPAQKITAVEPTQVARSNEALPEFRLRGLDWEPETASDEGRIIAAGSYDEAKRPDVFFDVTLKSVDK